MPIKQLLCLFAIAFYGSLTAQTTKQQDIQTLMTAMQLKATMQLMVDKGVEAFKKQKPAVPQQVWNDIKSKVDYDAYLNKAATSFDSNYSQPEIKNLTAAIKPKQLPQFKKIVQQQLYDAGKEFGKNFANLIKQTMATNGY